MEEIKEWLEENRIPQRMRAVLLVVLVVTLLVCIWIPDALNSPFFWKFIGSIVLLFLVSQMLIGWVDELW